MDFFQAQDLARRRTGRLIGLFVLAVFGIVAAGYAAGIGIVSFLRKGDTGWWDPQVLGIVSTLTVVVVGFSSVFKWFELKQGGAAVARRLGGTALDPNSRDEKHRLLLNVVEEMAIASGTPVPEVFVLERERSINAFAAGFTLADAAIGVTRGCLDHLTRDELQAVIAHEFSHILNGDMRLNLRITAAVFGILALALLGRQVIEGLRHVRPSRSRDGDKSGGALAAVYLGGLALLCIGYVGYFFGRLIQAAVSRQREFLADASAVQFTRNGDAVAGVLKKIGGLSDGSLLHSEHAEEFSHFYFAQGFEGLLDSLFATHPPLAERIRALEPGFDGNFPKVRRSPAEEKKRAARRVANMTPDAYSSFGNTVGRPTVVHLARARELIGSLPPALREAAHSTASATALVYHLMMDASAETRARQLALVEKTDPGSTRLLRELSAHAVPPEARLPLLHLALTPLADASPNRHGVVLRTLDELAREDGRMSLREYSLLKLVHHHLVLRLNPSGGPRQILIPSDVVPEITVILSALARLSPGDETGPEKAFRRGAREFTGLHPEPTLLPPDACTLKALDQALDLLAGTTFPARQRILRAAVDVCSADGAIRTEEAEMLRAMAAVLDCPVPPVLAEHLD